MQLSSTLFVLGAGSSAEFNLPTGRGLIRKVADDLAFQTDGLNIIGGDDEIRWEITRDRNRISELFRASAVLGKGLHYSNSIDDFLYNHGDDETVVRLGKIAIARAIMKAEHHSRLKLGEGRDAITIQMRSLQDTWLFGLFRILQTGIQRSNLHNLFSGIEIVNFNYDRCVEQFFYHAIQEAYSVGPDVAADVMTRLRIERPYGRVGALPWEKHSEPTVEFGCQRRIDLSRIATDLSTFTERDLESERVRQVKSAVGRARRVIFLGFGFHSQNMEILEIKRPPLQLPVYATMFDTSGYDQELFRGRISDSIMGGSRAPISVSSNKCVRFIEEFGQSLAADNQMVFPL